MINMGRNMSTPPQTIFYSPIYLPQPGALISPSVNLTT
jgi:hypothetical protein